MACCIDWSALKLCSREARDSGNGLNLFSIQHREGCSMKMPKTLIAYLSVVLLSASSVLQAAPPDQRPDHRPGGGGPPHGQRPPGGGPPGHHRPPPHRPPHGGRPPHDFTPWRQSVHQHRSLFGHGRPLPHGVHIVRGRPLPHGYGHAIDPRALRYLPHYPGYQWRRVGRDIVLISIGTGLVYSILSGVL